MLASEKGIISCMLLDKDISLTTRLLPEHFTSISLKKCFEVLMQYPGESLYIDILCEKAGIPADEGYDISSYVMTASGREQYEESVINSYIYRKYTELSDKIHQLSTGKEDIEKIKRVISDLGNVGVESLEEHYLIKGSMETAIKKAEGNNSEIICDFGFRLMDHFLGGYRKGSLITIGARTGVGKSTMSLCMIDKILEQGKACCLFSTEMSVTDIDTRYLSIKTGITQYQMENITEDISDTLIDRFAKVSASPDCVVYDRFGDFDNLCNLIRKNALNGVEIFFIDYLQNLRSNSKFSLKAHIIGEMSTKLKALALELGVNIVQMAQVNRESTKESNKRPRKEHLKESGDIEQDSDIILLLHDESEYDAMAPGDRLLVIVDKNRRGKRVDFELGIVRKYFSIYDL